jgi:hypothetical protein
VIAEPSVRRRNQAPLGLQWLAFVVGAVAGGLALGAAAHLLGQIGMAPAWLGPVAAAAALIGMVGPSAVRRAVARWGWPVPRSWQALGSVPFAGLFGLLLGVGVVTRLPSLGFVALLAWLLTTPAWASAIVLGLVFGGVRGILTPLAGRFTAPRGGRVPEVLRVLDRVSRLADFGQVPILLALLVAGSVLR